MKTEPANHTLNCSSSILSPYDMHESHSHEPLVAQTLQTSASPEPVNDDDQEEEEEEDDLGSPCGWGRLRPKNLQRFRTARWVLFWLCWAGFLQGLIVNGFINVVITTIEKRYQLRSTESGLIAGGYDIASFLCLIPVSYFGGSRSKPVFIGSGVLVLALGSFVFSLPHYMSGQYSFSQEQEDLCSAVNSTLDCSQDSVSQLSRYKYVFFLGQLLHGAGAAPFYTLGCTYLDENVPTKMSSVYLGIYYTMAVIGPAVGYLIGGQFLKLYVDIGVDPKELGLTSSSSVWVGAWWIGFIFTTILGALVAIPLTAFPKTLPGALRLRASKRTEMHRRLERSAASKRGFGSTLKDMPSSFLLLLATPTFLCLSLAGATEGMLVSGLATFLPKVIESQFSIAASWAAVLVGLVTIPGAGGGTFMGGYLVKRLNLRCAGIIKMCIVFSFICVGLVFIFILHCPNAKFAGLNQFLPNSSEPFASPKFHDSCNDACYCSPRQYDPICGADNVVYYSPCFAGCKSTYHLGSTKVYGDCGCITHPGRNMTIYGRSVMVQASREKCANYCTYMPVFLLLIFLSMLFTFLVSMPSLSGTLRCVAESQKSFALGVQWIAVRLLGTIPAPILFGSLIDLSCQLWQDTCNKQGACLFYDNQQMSTNVLILACVLKSLSCVFFFFAWLMYKPPEGAEDNMTKEDNCEIKDGVVGQDDFAITKNPPEVKIMNGANFPKASVCLLTATFLLMSLFETCRLKPPNEYSSSKPSQTILGRKVIVRVLVSPLDEALRCHICFDYFTNCMITKCSHNYCSVCIRRYMTYKSQCPTCFQVATEPELQNNRLVDEILRIYKSIRETLQIPSDSVDKQYPEQPGTSRADRNEEFTKPPKCDTSTYVAASDQTPRKTEEVSTSNEVSCPVCYITVPSDRINTHLDSCLKQSDERSQRKFLPKLVYHLLSDKQIRKKLKDHGLSASGDRQTLIKRHKSFLVLYNANCDSLNPRPVSDLLLEIERQELEERVNAAHRSIQVNKKSEPSVIEREHEIYVREHQSQFNALIHDVQQRDLARVPIKKEYVAVQEVSSSHIVDESGNIIGESSLRVGSPNLELVTVKTEIPETQAADSSDKLDNTMKVTGRSVLSEDKFESDKPPVTMQLFRVKKALPGVKMKEDSPSLLDVISNQDLSVDSSPVSLDDFEISKRQAIVHKKNARRRRSSDGKDSQRKK